MNEFIAIFCTISSKDEAKKIAGLHPYEVPEIISLNITDGLESYLSWLRENTK